MLKEKAGYLTRENGEKESEDFDWGQWISEQEKLVSDKKWYEKNLMNVLCENKHK